jgi:hypothetical protein
MDTDYYLQPLQLVEEQPPQELAEVLLKSLSLLKPKTERSLLISDPWQLGHCTSSEAPKISSSKSSSQLLQ